MQSCRQATRLLSDGMDRPLAWSERLWLGVHLLGCGPCCRFRRAIRLLRRALTAAAGDVPLPPDARQRVQTALDQAARDVDTSS